MVASAGNARNRRCCRSPRRCTDALRRDGRFGARRGRPGLLSRRRFVNDFHRLVEPVSAGSDRSGGGSPAAPRRPGRSRIAWSATKPSSAIAARATRVGGSNVALTLQRLDGGRRRLCLIPIRSRAPVRLMPIVGHTPHCLRLSSARHAGRSRPGRSSDRRRQRPRCRSAPRRRPGRPRRSRGDGCRRPRRRAGGARRPLT